MQMDTEKAVKPLRKLRKLLKDLPPHPAPEEVHDLRTRTRKLEAVVHTFSEESDGEAQRLLKVMKPVRKAAGKVRDMDVFIAKLHQIKGDFEGDGLVRLTEHIARLREKHLARLHQVIARRRKRARSLIKRYARDLESAADEVRPAAVKALAAELDQWPKLHADNLHEFRKHAKELRYMLQFASEADQERLDGLREVKDAAGEWHDWLELDELAKEVLEAERDRELLRQIDAAQREKLRTGLTAANRLRKNGIDVPEAA